MKFRSSLYLSMIAALLATCGSGLAQDAQSYPDKPVRIIVPLRQVAHRTCWPGRSARS